MRYKKLKYTIIILVLLIGTGMYLSFNSRPLLNQDSSRFNIPKASAFKDLYTVEINTTWGGLNQDLGYNIKLHESSIFLCGRTDSIGSGDFDSLLIKMDEDGNELWNTTWGGSEVDYATHIDFDSSDNIFVGGNTDSFGPSAPGANFMMIKYQSSGEQLWNRTWGTSEGEWGGRIVVDSLDNVYYAGVTWGYIASSAYIAFVKHNNSGNELWTKYWGNGNRNHAIGITIDSFDNIFITGYGGNTVDNDVCLLKYSDSGDLELQPLWGGSGIDRGYDIQNDASGNIFITGYTESYGTNTDAFLLKYSSSGNLQWSKIWGGNQYDMAHTLSIDSLGNVYIAGQTKSFGDLNGDNFIVKYTNGGEQIWNYTWGGDGEEFTRGMFIDSSDNIYLTGSTTSYGVGGSDVFLLKFSSYDLQLPEITILSPQESEFFQSSAPTYSLSITNSYEAIWYSLESGTNYTASGLTGTIDQAAWSALSDGIITIDFYANNSAGMVGTAQVMVIKDSSVEPPPAIPGYNLFLIMGVISIIAIIIVLKRPKL